MTLYEVYYHDPWRTYSTYARQYITTSPQDAEQWLLDNLDDWYCDNDSAIDSLLDQALDKEFTYMTVTTITINDDGTVEWNG